MVRSSGHNAARTRAARPRCTAHPSILAPARVLRRHSSALHSGTRPGSRIRARAQGSALRTARTPQYHSCTPGA
eukprot:13044557-Alexandrium_andersonii.AAC.1